MNTATSRRAGSNMTSPATWPNCVWAAVVLLGCLLSVREVLAQESQDVPAATALREARAAAERGDSAEAVRRCTEALNRDPKLAEAYYVRGREQFRLSKMRESLADFDHFIELRPDLASRQWERGITCYYAGEFQRGADQFARYQTYQNADVENAVWRFLCMVHTVGWEQARKELLTIRGDSRVPLMEVYALFRGQGTVEGVTKAVGQGDPSAAERAGRQFYADLYLGLYFDARGERGKAKPYLQRAADPKLRENPRVSRYMWDVARIHLQQLGRMGK